MLSQLALGWLCAVPTAAAQTTETVFPPHFEAVPWAEADYWLATSLTFDPAGAAWITTRFGEVWRYEETLPEPERFIDLRDEVLFEGDRGLLSLALHPGFTPDGGDTSWVYLLYIVSPIPGEDPAYGELDEHGEPSYGFGRLTRYRALTDEEGSVVVDPESRHILLGNEAGDGTVPDAIASVHKSHSVGDLEFAADGTLWISSGDGAHWDIGFDTGGDDPAAFESYVHPVTGLHGPYSDVQDIGMFRAQDLRSLSGKILRIDPETGLGLKSNPFFDGDPASNPSRVWAYGLRNPFRIRHVPNTGVSDPDEGEPGLLLIGDVGNAKVEELDRCAGGENFGWPCLEGTEPLNAAQNHRWPSPNPFGWTDCSQALAPPTAPVFSYRRQDPAEMVPFVPHFEPDGTPGPGFTGSCVIAGAFYMGGADYPPEYDRRFFFSDYGNDHVVGLDFDGQFRATGVHTFAKAYDRVVDMEVRPTDGRLYVLELGTGSNTATVSQIRYGFNLSPVAVLEATPETGLAPLEVTFDASGSTDPENDPLSYSFNFGDGTPPLVTTDPVVSHTYEEDGFFQAIVTVSDDAPLSSVVTAQIVVGDQSPIVAIETPRQGEVVEAPGSLLLSGSGFDPFGEELEYEWVLDLHHNDHVHPAFSIAFGLEAEVLLDDHGEGTDIYYFRVELVGTRPSDGAVARDAVFVLPDGQLLDRAGTMLPIAAVHALSPPGPMGLGQPDLEVIRDGVAPAPGAGELLQQFDTEHSAAGGIEDWVGFEYAIAPPAYEFLVGLTFTEGEHQPGGGWFEDLDVEVRTGGTWQTVTGLASEPPYASSGAPGFSTYSFRFDPIQADGVRLIGPPGAGGFISAAELRVHTITPAALSTDRDDLTSDAIAVIGRLFEQDPPVSFGEGSGDPATLHNGTYPAAGSTSALAQFDTYHPDTVGSLEDWIGYRFEQPRTLDGLVFQEGLHGADGGWFEDLSVSTRLSPADPWVAVTGLAVDPPYRHSGSATTSYRTFRLDFDPVVARSIRIEGPVDSPAGYVSLGELRVLGPWFDGELCGAFPYGETAANPMLLASATPPLVGKPLALTLSGAPVDGPALGGVVLAAAPDSIPLLSGVVLVDLLGALILSTTIDEAGEGLVLFDLPDNPALGGVSLYAQGLVSTPQLAFGMRWSNGLELRVCP